MIRAVYERVNELEEKIKMIIEAIRKSWLIAIIPRIAKQSRQIYEE
jgi:hypothetical protein